MGWDAALGAAGAADPSTGQTLVPGLPHLSPEMRWLSVTRGAQLSDWGVHSSDPALAWPAGAMWGQDE